MIFDFKKGFLMYHVEVRNVRMNSSSSVFPVNSNLSGDVLGFIIQHDYSLEASEGKIDVLHGEVEIIHNIFDDVLWKTPERHRNFLGKR